MSSILRPAFLWKAMSRTPKAFAVIRLSAQLMALWRLVTTGEVPQGVILRPA
jgi:hypothetical protein